MHGSQDATLRGKGKKAALCRNVCALGVASKPVGMVHTEAAKQSWGHPQQAEQPMQTNSQRRGGAHRTMHVKERALPCSCLAHQLGHLPRTGDPCQSTSTYVCKASVASGQTQMGPVSTASNGWAYLPGVTEGSKTQLLGPPSGERWNL